MSETAVAIEGRRERLGAWLLLALVTLVFFAPALLGSVKKTNAWSRRLM